MIEYIPIVVMYNIGQTRELLGGISEFTLRNLISDINLKPHVLRINNRKSIRFDTNMIFELKKAKQRRGDEKLRKRIVLRETKYVPWKPKNLDVEETINMYKKTKYFYFFSNTFFKQK